MSHKEAQKAQKLSFFAPFAAIFNLRNCSASRGLVSISAATALATILELNRHRALGRVIANFELRELDTVLNTSNLTHANRDFGGDDAAAGDGMESSRSAGRSRPDDGLPA
jgi:hypothetical protein